MKVLIQRDVSRLMLQEWRQWLVFAHNGNHRYSANHALLAKQGCGYFCIEQNSSSERWVVRYDSYSHYTCRYQLNHVVPFRYKALEYTLIHKGLVYGGWIQTIYNYCNCIGKSKRLQQQIINWLYSTLILIKVNASIASSKADSLIYVFVRKPNVLCRLSFITIGITTQTVSRRTWAWAVGFHF